MPRYLIERTIESAAGTQTYWVDADNEDDALKKHEAGEGAMYASECEVQNTTHPTVCGVTTFDDYGEFPPETPNV